MRIFDALALATIAELGLCGALLGFLALLGRWNGWLDLAAQLAPVWFAVSACAAVLGWFAVAAGPDRNLIFAAAAVGVVCTAMLMAPEYLRRLPAPSRSIAADAVKIVTFNVWCRNFDPDITVDAILAAGADVVALQEFSGLPQDAVARLRDVYAHWVGCEGDCDIALLSKHPWRPLGTNTLGANPQFVAGETGAATGRTLPVISVHYPWPMPPSLRQAQRTWLGEIVGALDRADLILVGDLNLTPWSAALRRHDADLAPLTRRTRASATWPANFDRINQPFPFPILAIDQIYAGPAWRTVSLRRLPRTGSDHWAQAVLSFSPERSRSERRFRRRRGAKRAPTDRRGPDDLTPIGTAVTNACRKLHKRANTAHARRRCLVRQPPPRTVGSNVKRGPAANTASCASFDWPPRRCRRSPAIRLSCFRSGAPSRNRAGTSLCGSPGPTSARSFANL